MSNSSLVNIRVSAHPSNYSGASYRLPIKEIVIHHMAGILTAERCGGVFAGAGRGASAHYGVGCDGLIGQYVDESCVAWHCGNWYHNQQSVSIELANSATGGDWPVSDRTLDICVRLVADIAKRNNLGRLAVGRNLNYHSMYSQTECPGNFVRSRMQYIADRANEILKKEEEMSNPKAPTLIWTRFPKTKKYQTKLEPTILWNFGHLKFQDRKEVKRYKKGETIEIAGSVLVEETNSTYLVTQYSLSRYKDNGFNIVDMEEIAPKPEVKPEPKPEPKPVEPQKPIEQPKEPETPNQPTPKPEAPTEPPVKPEEQLPTIPPIESGMTQKQWNKYIANGMQTVKLFEKAGEKFGWRINLSNKAYDLIKKIALILPMISFLYIGLAEIWGFGFAEQIDATIKLAITSIDAFLGMVVIKASSDYKKK